MCGLAAIVDFDDVVDVRRTVSMATSMAHRGPDGTGHWSEPGIAIAHRRLAIIDLSTAGGQPMADESGRYRIVHNGEIYNYKELRRELESLGHRFRSQTDTEVVVAAFSAW